VFRMLVVKLVASIWLRVQSLFCHHPYSQSYTEVCRGRLSVLTQNDNDRVTDYPRRRDACALGSARFDPARRDCHCHRKCARVCAYRTFACSVTWRVRACAYVRVRVLCAGGVVVPAHMMWRASCAWRVSVVCDVACVSVRACACARLSDCVSACVRAGGRLAHCFSAASGRGGLLFICRSRLGSASPSPRVCLCLCVPRVRDVSCACACACACACVCLHISHA
jgi:hypothetical protein